MWQGISREGISLMKFQENSRGCGMGPWNLTHPIDQTRSPGPSLERNNRPCRRPTLTTQIFYYDAASDDPFNFQAASPLAGNCCRKGSHSNPCLFSNVLSPAQFFVNPCSFRVSDLSCRPFSFRSERLFRVVRQLHFIRF